ncbi:hypothetical protein CGCF413_v012162 [Colletotrichum fructicola]|nr:hypothetical protein CGCF413_v012162 [Colletotrichum fructicola]
MSEVAVEDMDYVNDFDDGVVGAYHDTEEVVLTLGSGGLDEINGGSGNSRTWAPEKEEQLPGLPWGLLVLQTVLLLVGRHLSEDPRPSTWLLDWTQQPDIGRSPQLPRTRTRTKDQEPGVQPAVVASRHATYLPA